MNNKFEDSSIEKQLNEFINILLNNPKIADILNKLEFPRELNWYLVGGCINQTVFNHISNKQEDYGIGDYDIFYWDDDLSEETEIEIAQDVSNQLKELEIKLDVVNQARVHQWFESFFGVKKEPYKSMEHAIRTVPSTITSIGIAKKDNDYFVYAPFGLSDIFEMKLRYNPETFIPEKFVIPKIEKWMNKWGKLTEIPGSYPRK